MKKGIGGARRLGRVTKSDWVIESSEAKVCGQLTNDYAHLPTGLISSLFARKYA